MIFYVQLFSPQVIFILINHPDEGYIQTELLGWIWKSVSVGSFIQYYIGGYCILMSIMAWKLSSGKKVISLDSQGSC